MWKILFIIGIWTLDLHQFVNHLAKTYEDFIYNSQVISNFQLIFRKINQLPANLSHNSNSQSFSSTIFSFLFPLATQNIAHLNSFSGAHNTIYKPIINWAKNQRFFNRFRYEKMQQFVGERATIWKACCLEFVTKKFICKLIHEKI